jgi:hypothetical protein
MSRAANLAGFSTSISPSGDLTVGIVTATSFIGNITGTASTATAAATAYGLTGSPNVTVGVITATRISAGNTTGTSGQILQSTGTGVTWTAAPVSGLSITDSNVIGYSTTGIRSDSAAGRLEVFGAGNFTVYESPGTFVVNPGISSIRVRVVGGGGNGSSGPPGGFGPGAPAPPGQGGTGGGYAHKVITSFSAPRTYSITVGTAPGGTSSFGSEVSATGGANSPGPGIAGTGSNGDVNFSGGTPPPSLGVGGTSGTQLGNGTIAIPRTTPNTRGSLVRRFPFDIFETLFEGPLRAAAGGAAGTSGPPASPATAGGIGGGGGGGIGGVSIPPAAPPSFLNPGQPGAAGGPGIVIVEW